MKDERWRTNLPRVVPSCPVPIFPGAHVRPAGGTYWGGSVSAVPEPSDPVLIALAGWRFATFARRIAQRR